MLSLLNPKVLKIAAVIAVIFVIAFFSYRAGADHEKAKALKAIEAQQKEWAKDRETLLTKSQEIKVVYRDKIKTVRQVVDSCADTSISPDILSQLQ